MNAERFRRVVNRVEAKKIPPRKLAAKVIRALKSTRTRLVYKVNRNPLLLFLNALPRRMQLAVIRRMLS